MTVWRLPRNSQYPRRCHRPRVVVVVERRKRRKEACGATEPEDVCCRLGASRMPKGAIIDRSDGDKVALIPLCGPSALCSAKGTLYSTAQRFELMHPLPGTTELHQSTTKSPPPLS